MSDDYEAKKRRRRRGKGKSASRVANARKSPALSSWRRACMQLGYMKKGAGFKPIPRRGTAEYNRIKALQQQLQGKGKY